MLLLPPQTNWPYIGLRFNSDGSSSHVHSTGDHVLTQNEIPAHTHNLATNPNQGSYYRNSVFIDGGGNNNFKYLSNATTENTGGGKAHNHGNTGSSSSLPPYLSVYMWKRTA